MAEAAKRPKKTFFFYLDKSKGLSAKAERNGGTQNRVDEQLITPSSIAPSQVVALAGRSLLPLDPSACRQILLAHVRLFLFRDYDGQQDNPGR